MKLMRMTSTKTKAAKQMRKVQRPNSCRRDAQERKEQREKEREGEEHKVFPAQRISNTL